MNTSTLVPFFQRSATTAFFIMFLAMAASASDLGPVVTSFVNKASNAFSLTSFTTKYKNYQMICTWTVSNQEKMQVYELEGSDNGSTFRSIRQMFVHKAAEYTLVNTKKANICDYYRLKMTDEDGGVFYSGILPTR